MSSGDTLTVEQYVIKRDGSRALFCPDKIRVAIEKAFCAEHGLDVTQVAGSIRHQIDAVYERVLTAVHALLCEAQGTIDIETIQDHVEKELMTGGFHQIARSYILYREGRARVRSLHPGAEKTKRLTVTESSGERRPLEIGVLQRRLALAAQGVETLCNPVAVLEETLRHLYDGATEKEVHRALVFAARTFVEREPAYAQFAAQLLLQEIYLEVLGCDLANEAEPAEVAARRHRECFADYVRRGIEIERLSPELLSFDLAALASHLLVDRDRAFSYLGLQILHDRYLIHDEGKRIETPQFFWMRVAMGLALREKEKERRAIEFYEVFSRFLYVSSTPTLFNAGTCHPQLSSCYLSTTYDDLDHIFKVIADNARLSKWAGGLGNDWTPVRARGAFIKGTNGLTQGIIPFLKVVNDTAVAVNQGGKRKGAVCAYLEVWHLDFEDFLELRKNTGDDRRRTHDMNTAAWVPDLFMKRVQNDGSWTFFNPSEAKDLHDLYGSAFEERYCHYERLAQTGELKQHRTVSAVTLWRKMLTMLFETGHPWITFKDACNVRSPQRHAGVIHSSNLCTEITLNTSDKETAVCNLGSVNLAAHMRQEEGGRWVIDQQLIRQTIFTAMRMLDNVIDINFYPTPEAAAANQAHRPVGLGIMAFQDALYMQNIRYDSQAAVEFSDESTEIISYWAIMASSELAAERGSYHSFKGSAWDQGLLPIDTIALLEKERGGHLKMDRTTRLDWSRVREAIAKQGMRNSNTMAIAPTATIAHIVGVLPSIEPTYANLFSRSNLSGDFTWLNPYLVAALKKADLWDQDMVEDLKHYNGSLAEIERVPEEIKQLFKTAFEIDPRWYIECGSRRQKWLDMAQSLNLYVKSSIGSVFSQLYFYGWEMGLKTFYYLRTLAATQIEKATVDVNARGIQPTWMKHRSASSNIKVERGGKKSCAIDDENCESCQ